jgi:hypothetical protein
VARALHAAGWLAVRADGPRRHDFGPVRGWRSDLTAASADGRLHRGSVLYAERESRLTLLLWLGAAAHPRPGTPEAIEAMFASVRFAD